MWAICIWTFGYAYGYMGIQDPQCRMLDPESWTLNPGSWILNVDPGYRIQFRHVLEHVSVCVRVLVNTVLDFL